MRVLLELIRSIALFAGLTLLTQVGGFIWLATRLSLSRWRLSLKRKIGIHVAVYGLVSIVLIPPLARIGGRVTMPIWPTDSAPVAPRSILYALTNRHYVKPEVRDVVVESARKLRQAYPGSVVHYLDAAFPFFDWFHMMPHLSHAGGEAIDLTFCYHVEDDPDRYTLSPSPLGYGVYENPKPGETQPYRNQTSPLRWDLPFLQGANRHRVLDRTRTRHLVRSLVMDSRTRKVLLEVHLHQRWGIVHHKLRFQQLHAARHDDHIHLWVRTE